jgi:cold shock protein
MTSFDPPVQDGRIRGKVINFFSRKGYGFILGENGMKVFVHYSDIKGKDYRTLTAGEPVEYTVNQGQRGLQAVNVVRLDPPEIIELPSLIGGKTW